MGKCDAANPLYDEISGSEGKHGWIAFLSSPSQDIKKMMYFLIKVILFFIKHAEVQNNYFLNNFHFE